MECAPVFAGGAGAVALLIGPDAPLVMDPAWRASYAANVVDFAKPVGALQEEQSKHK